MSRAPFVRAVGITALLLAAVSLAGQAPPASPLRLVTASGTRPIPTVVQGDIEMIALDDLAGVFGVTVREDTVARAITVGYNGKTIVLSQDQALASVSGRLVSLPSAPARINSRWHVPVEFVARALGTIYDAPLDLRKSSRLLIQGNLRVPRVLARHDVAGNQARVTLDVTPEVPHQIVQEEGRLLVRFEADLIDLTAAPVQSQGFVQGIRLADPPRAVAVQLGPQFGSFRGADTPLSPGGVRITLDIFGIPEQTAATPPPEATAPGAATGPIPPTPPPAFRPTAVKTIVIDPGHGGEDEGVRGASGSLEKSVTLAVARRLKAQLESRIGARVLLTRDRDAAVGLDERAAVANNNKADLFVSLHANASLRRGASGAEVFSRALDATPGAEVFSLALDATDDVVQQVAGSQGIAMPVFGGGTREIDVILWEMAQARHTGESAVLAQLVEQRLREVVPMSPQSLQQAPMRVLVGANMPAVLVEMGYLTNPTQESQLASGPFQGRIVSALVAAIERFFASAPPQASRVPGESSPGAAR